MTHRPKHLLSPIEAEELHEAIRGMCGHAEGETFDYYVSTHHLLQGKGLVEIVGSEWDPSVNDVTPTEAGRDEHLRYQNLPRFEDQLIQAISYLETFHTQITMSANDQSFTIPPGSSLSETLIMLAAMLQNMAGVQ